MNSTYYGLNIIYFNKKRQYFFFPEKRLEAKNKREKSWTVGKRKKERKKEKKKEMERVRDTDAKSHGERGEKQKGGRGGREKQRK